MVSPEYIAGFFDGEGCVRVANVRKFLVVRISIGQKFPRILNEIREYLSSGKVYKRGSGSYNLIISRQSEVIDTLRIIIPHLIGKREQAELALDFLTSYYKESKRLEIAMKIKELKRVAP